MEHKLKVGVVGAGFVAAAHVEALQRFVPNAEVVAAASPHSAGEFASRFKIPQSFDDFHDLVQLKEIDLVSLCLPNDLHREVTLLAARAGKHIVCEKPLCLTLAEADEMIDTCRQNGVLLMYAENLVFAPKYVRLKQMIDEGAVGKPFLAKQAEEHSGPHMPWFWDVTRSGGGVLMDMGCHSIEYTRWILGKPPVRSVTAMLGTFVHGGRTQGEDHSICIVEYQTGQTALAENSWAKGGGVDDRAEVYGDQGNARADLVRGSSLMVYSEAGYGYAVEKAGETRGFSFPMFEETWNSGFPQELQHFVNAALGVETPRETGEDGREVLKIILAAYQAAGEGRKITWPYDPPPVAKPIDLWKKPASTD